MIAEQIKRGKVLYIDKKRALAWARENRLQLPARPSSKGKANVLTPEDVVKWENHQRTDINFSLANPKSNSKLDKEYFAAIERGDMQKAREMVLEQARVREYLTDEEWKDMHRAPNPQGGDLSILEMAQGKMNVPGDFWTHPHWYGNNESTHSDSFYTIKRLIERTKNHLASGKSKNSIPGIRVYRAVPKEIKEDIPRNADWVTPSEDYAREHGESRFGTGKYTIQRIFARADQLWWDSNDINELGFDDGKEYAYRNTKNNRKLLDTVTYEVVEVRDENGKKEGHDLGEWDSEKGDFIKTPYRYNLERRVVPLSKRFNYRHWGTSFSLAQASVISKLVLAPRANEAKARSLMRGKYVRSQQNPTDSESAGYLNT